MGAGPVFIVYASLNLNKNAAFPAATWLLVFRYPYRVMDRYVVFLIVFSFLL